MVKSTAVVSHRRSDFLDILRKFNKLQLETRKLRTVTILSFFLNSLLLFAYTVSSAGAKPATFRFLLAKNFFSSTVTSLVRLPAENPLLLAPLAVSLLVTAFLTTAMKRLGNTFSSSLWKAFACSAVVHLLLVDSLLPVIDAGVLIMTVDDTFFIAILMLANAIFAAGFCSFLQLRLWWLKIEALQKAERKTLNGSKRKIEYWFAVNFCLAPWQVIISVHCLISFLTGFRCTDRFKRSSEIVLAFLLIACNCGMAWFQQLSYILVCLIPEEEDDACMGRGLAILQI